MNRRSTTVVGAAFAIVAGAGVVGIGQRLASERQREREHYRLELVRLRQEAARTPEKVDKPTDTAAAAGGGTETRTICAGGADTLTLAAYHAAPTAIVKDGRLDVAKFAALSDQSIRAERYVEESHEPPALPHRLGNASAPACFPITVSKPPAKSPAPARSNRVRGR